jgi:hypothetical protein
VGGNNSPFAVICIGDDLTRYELRRGDRPGHFTLSRIGKSYAVTFRSDDDWSCTCPAAGFRPRQPCKHARVVALLQKLVAPGPPA